MKRNYGTPCKNQTRKLDVTATADNSAIPMTLLNFQHKQKRNIKLPKFDLNIGWKLDLSLSTENLRATYHQEKNLLESKVKARSSNFLNVIDQYAKLYSRSQSCEVATKEIAAIDRDSSIIPFILDTTK